MEKVYGQPQTMVYLMRIGTLTDYFILLVLILKVGRHCTILLNFIFIVTT